MPVLLSLRVEMEASVGLVGGPRDGDWRAKRESLWTPLTKQAESGGLPLSFLPCWLAGWLADSLARYFGQSVGPCESGAGKIQR